MSKIDELIAKLCPDGVKYRTLSDVCKISSGKDHKELTDGNIPVYGSGGVMRFVDTFIYDKQSVLIPRKGSISNLFYVNTPFWVVDTIFYTEVNEELMLPKFLYYYLTTQHLEDLNTAGGVPSLTKSILDKVSVSVPPVSVQHEIVQILDKFTMLEAELEAELEARNKQYEYYRETLLNYSDDLKQSTVKWMTLGEIGPVSMCKRIFKEQTHSVGDIPFYKIGTFGKEPNAFIPRSLFEEYKEKFSYPKKGDVLLSASGTIGRAVIFDGTPSYFQDSNIVWIANDEETVLNKYLYYCYSVAKWAAAEGGTIARLYNDNIRKTKIPVPPIQEQERIVAILDRFDALVNDITQGLPAEIAARRKQYEYYRDKLLTFKEKVS